MGNRDGTGPDGKGPLTGRKKGYCKEADASLKRMRLKPRKKYLLN